MLSPSVLEKRTRGWRAGTRVPRLGRKAAFLARLVMALCSPAAALRAWNSCNEYMPSRIIVYRDGVGDGQLKTLVNYEVPQFLDCLKSVGRGYK